MDERKFQKVLGSSVIKKYKKGQLLVAEGSIYRKTHFIRQGVVIAYYVDLNGVEHVVQIGIEGWWISDIQSYIAGGPARLNVEAMEDCEVYEFSVDQMEQLYQEVPAMTTYFLRITQNAFASFQNRVLANLSASAEDRYKAFIQKYPKLEQRLPQKIIASYIGVTPESLSRLKKKLMER